MKKNRISPLLRSKASKQAVSIIMAAAMLFSYSPFNPLYEEIYRFFSDLSFTAYAATEEDWLLDPGEPYSITSAESLSKYSVAYHVNPNGHKNDIIEINMSQSQPTDKVEPFYSLGEGLVNGTLTEVPFRGTITINHLSDSYINIDKALFAAIGEDAVIRDESYTTADDGNGGTTNVYSPYPLWIRRTSSANPNDPVFAKKVCVKAEGATTSGADLGWEVTIKTFLINGNPVQSTVGGLIGEIEAGAKVKISLTDERCMDVASSASDIGYICGKMGDGAELEIGTVTSSGVTVTASASGKHAGAIVGNMSEGAKLKLPASMTSFPVTAVTASGANSYAGGIVGNNYKGSIEFTGTGTPNFSITQTLGGKLGSGGISGYYEPALTSGSVSIDYKDYTVNCTLNGTGSSGGLYGVLNNSTNNGSITITDSTNTAARVQVGNNEKTTNFGGLIGSYTASSLDNTLTLTNCASKPGQTGSSTNFGGAIGIAGSKTYVRLNNFTTNNTSVKDKSGDFGGAVGKADGAFIDINSLTVSAPGDFNGGGVVNDLGNGVLRMNGTIDLTSAKSAGGQIVNKRTCGLVFAESTWTLNRSTSAAKVDDIGSWGEVIRFNASDFTKASVLTHSEGNHYVTLLSSVTSMSNSSEFARTALNIQHNTGGITESNAVLRFTAGSGTAGSLLGTSSANGTELSLSGTFSLSGTGIQGLTRDDGTQTYNGATFNGGGHTLTLAIGENYGNRSSSPVLADGDGSGKIYKHKNVGLFGKTNGATIQNVTFAGNIYVGGAEAKQHVGAAAADNNGGFTAYGVTVSTAIHNSGDKQQFIGGLLGGSTRGNITIGGSGNISETNPAVSKACTINANITGSNSSQYTCIGGAVGYVSSDAFTAAINNVTVSGTISNSSEKPLQEIGGLIAFIEAGSGTRTLSLESVTVSGITVRGGIGQTYDTDKKKYLKEALSIGGLLGYAWYDTTVSMNSVTVSGEPVVRADFGAHSQGVDVDMAGLVYAGSGSWTIGTVTVPNISVVTYNGETAVQNVRSFGMIVNRSFKIGGNALYLVLPDMSNYKLGTYTGSNLTAALSKASNFGGFKLDTVFDELVAYSAYYEEDSDCVRTSKVLENGQGIVSIRTKNNTSTVNNVMQGSCNTYQNQVTDINMGNPNTRYYYDIDLLLDKKSGADNYEAELAAYQAYQDALEAHNADPDNIPAPEGPAPTEPEEPAAGLLTSADKLMLWSLNKYAHSSLNSFEYNPFDNDEIAPTGTETFDMVGYSYYPVNVSDATIKGTFKLYNEEIEDGEAAGTAPDSYSRTTLNDSYSAFTANPYTQHHLMQNGIFLDASGNVTVNGMLKLQGTIGADTYNNGGCGALICGTINGSVDSTTGEAHYATLTDIIKNEEGTVTSTGKIILDGIKVHNIGNRNSTTYAPLLVNRIDSYTDVDLEDISNTNEYGTTGTVAASSLIGDAGTSTTSRNINLKFNKIKLDGRKQSISSGDSDLTTAYQTSLSLFTKATLLNKYQYFTGSTGIYNYAFNEDWGGAGARAVTYGEEVGHNSGEGEWGDKEQRYLAEAGSTDEPFYTHPDSQPDASSTLYNEFSRFLPYVATGYNDTNKTHELKVNHGKTPLTGCGTYNHPYLVTDGDQLSMIADIIAGYYDSTSVFMPCDSPDIGNKWHGGNGCKNHTYNGSKYLRSDNNKQRETNEVRQHLAGAYYKIGENINLPSDYRGLGSTTDAKFAFCGVIVSDEGAEITNLSENPLILNSNGSVIKNISLKVQKSGISTVDTTAQFAMNTSVEAYGAVIGRIFGGDNIIDEVSVTFASGTTIIPDSKRVPIGGYVGTIIAGDVIFKNMDSVTNKTGLTSSVCSYLNDSGYLYINPIIGRVINGYAVTESNAYRPFENGTRTSGGNTVYWANGSVTTAEPSTVDRVTMKNGTKNYSITDLNKNQSSKLQIGAFGDSSPTGSGNARKTTITFPNSQSIFVLSCLVQEGVTSNSANYYSPANIKIKSYDVSSYNNVTYNNTKYQADELKPSRLANYNHIGENSDDTNNYPLTNTNSYPGYDDYTTAKNDFTSNFKPYLIANYVDSTNRDGVFRVTNINTVCDIGFTGNANETWYLPDGFRGLGSIDFGDNSSSDTDKYLKYMTFSINKLSGLIDSNIVNIDLNMTLKQYDYDYENYDPCGYGGFGLFNTVRHNRDDQTPADAVPTDLENRTNDDYKIMYLNITGNIFYDVVSSGDIMEYKYANVLGGSSTYANYLHTGGLIGCSKVVDSKNSNLNIEHIGISGLSVNGFKTTGGILGYLNLGKNSSYLATISNINTDSLTVTSKLYSGGIVGCVEQTGITIDEVTITSPDIRTYFVGDNFSNGTAGVIGCAKNEKENRPITISNITIGSLGSSSSIGRDSSVNLINSNDYNKICAAGIVGECNTDSSTYLSTVDDNKYSIVFERCKVYNISFYGNHVAGIMAHSSGNSTIKISDVEVKSSVSSEIVGMTFEKDHQGRGCGGLAGYISLNSNKYVHFDHCTVEGYSLRSFNDTGGICANLQGSGGSAIIQNIKLKGLKFDSHYAGGMFGYMNRPLTGLNIQLDNLQFKSYSSYLRKGNALMIVKTGGAVIKLAGFSRHDAESTDEGYEFLGRMTSVSTDNNKWDEYAYGTGGYVIFSDYQGASMTEQINDWSVHSYQMPLYDENHVVTGNENRKKLNEYNTFSPVHQSDNNVAISSQDYVVLPKTVDDNGTTKAITDSLTGEVITYNDYYGIDQNFPYVTSSPFMNIGIDSTGTDQNGADKVHNQFLTGDGVSGLSYDTSSAHKVLADWQETTKPNNYYNQLTLTDKTVNGSTVTGYKYLDDLLATKYLTFKTITASEYPDELEILGVNFPVLVLDDNDGTNLTYLLNSYLQTLTNTKYNFAACKVSADANAASASDIFNLKIAKCVFNSSDKKFDITYKDTNLHSSDPAANNASLYVDNGNFGFNINRVDSGSAQFTLIDVEFYDPSTSGNSKKVAYHLYVPVYVSQMLKFDFQISSKSGSNYKLDEYTSSRGNATLENVGTPITIEARYIYQRDLTEWQKAAENGESLLRAYDKTWDINDNTHKGFPVGTKMVLVDPNQGNKAYYSTLTNGQVYGSGTDVVTDQQRVYSDELTDEEKAEAEVHKLYLNRFLSQETDDNDQNLLYTSNQFNDYLDITVVSDSSGKFVETNNPAEATICAKLNGIEKYFKPKTNETGVTFYKISNIEYSSMANTGTYNGSTYLYEDYYLTIFMPKTEDQTMYHYSFVAPDNLGDIAYPSRYTRIDGRTAKQDTRVVTGNLFTYVDASLSTSIYEGETIKGSNDVDVGSVIKVDVSNKICLTSQMFNNKSFLDNNTVKINQIFLMSMNKQLDINQTTRGIETEPIVNLNSYTVGGQDRKAYCNTNKKYDSNYLYLPNGQELRVMLKNAPQADGVLIHTNLDLSYSSSDGISMQFPKREEALLNDNTIGTWIGCNSSIASTESAAIASKMTYYIDEQTANPSNSLNLYYSRSSTSASLLYSSDDYDGKYSHGNYYDQLGINAKDLPTEVTNSQCPMNTVVVYDVSKLISIIDDADGVELTFRLVRKDNNGRYTVNLDISDYLVENPSFGSSLSATTSDTGSNSKMYTYTFAKTDSPGLQHSGGVYTIPINFKVKTNFSGVDQATHYYSNYKVIVSASLYKIDAEAASGRILLGGTTADDHIIYTNAKIDSNAIP